MSTTIINQIKDPDELYQSELIEHTNGTFECPVCNKIYKRKTSAVKHYAKQDCYSTFDLFADTPYEESAFGLYESIIAEQNPRARTNLKAFRKSKMYSSAVRFITFCYMNEVDDFGLYYSYLKTIKNYSIPNAILTQGLNEENLRDYRIFLHQHPRYVDSKEFWDRHSEQLLNDEDFFIRSLEKAHITLYSVKARKKALDMVDKLPIGYQFRMGELMDKVDG